jgi:putative ABC transport system permease protein
MYKHTAMGLIFRNFKSTLRNARKKSVMSLAKLFGLSISFAVVLLVAGYVYYETSFDKCIPDHELIYRCLMQGQLNDQDADFAVTSPEMAAAIVAEIPEITEAIRIRYRGEPDIMNKDEVFTPGPLYFADPGFFSFFSIPVITELENPLANNDNVVISGSLAQKLFGSANTALGESIEIRGEKAIVTGVFKDLPGNFHLRIELIQSLQKSNPDQVGWGSQEYFTYFKTSRQDIDLDELNFKISKTVYTHYDSRIDGARAETMEDLKHYPEMYMLFTAERLTDIHFSNHKFDWAVTSSRVYLYGAIILVILVLVISSANFINLTIADISTRLKDIGIKKTVGAKTRDIVWYFLHESLIYFSACFIVALLIYDLARDPILAFLDIEIALSSFEFYIILSIVLIALLLVSIISHIAPVFLIARTKTLCLVKNDRPVKKGFSFRNGFVLLQFILAALVVLTSFIVSRQVNFMITGDRGYDTTNVIMLNMWAMNPETRRSFIGELKSHGPIKSISTSDEFFGEDIGMTGAFFDKIEEENYFHTTRLPVDAEFFNTFNMELIEGRFFEKDMQTDYNAVILNQSAAKIYAGNGTLPGKKVFLGDISYEVIGIVKDFNFRSLHHPIQPMVLTHVDNFGIVYVKVDGNQIAESLGIIRSLWDQFNIPIPYKYTFHDEVVARHYHMDQQAKRLLLVLLVISCAIACVGLYAISFFSIVKRTKEIGIRKVNGAKVREVMVMLNLDFIRWVAVAFMIAVPVAWYAMDRWLQNFAYRIELSWWIFALAGLMTMVIALLTVSWQTWRAARRNPVEALRYE